MKKEIHTLKPFEGFKCIGKSCTTNCCIGWQIDIDKKTLKKYKKAKGDFAEKLKSGVDFKNGRFLTCKKNGENRCVFLNDENLCEIIINLGENYLCEVCRKHPRFYNEYKGFIEKGVGLACERAANMLIRSTDDLSICATVNMKKLNAWEREILTWREKFIRLSTDKNLNLKSRIDKIMDEIGVDKEALNRCEFAKIIEGFESINPLWKEKFKDFKFDKCDFINGERYFENILVYFLFRHVPLAADGLDLKSRTLFSVLSVAIIYYDCKLNNDFSADNVVSSASKYSAETEYSDFNVNLLLDRLDEISLQIKD
ncbi:MAG: flagellin lysine-N-methylase [Clostridia bacterium]|nr:flagellin lysine-N-methylase [Clostridia bacterium]